MRFVISRSEVLSGFSIECWTCFFKFWFGVFFSAVRLALPSYNPPTLSHLVSTDPITLTLGAGNPSDCQFQYSVDASATFYFLSSGVVKTDGTSGGMQASHTFPITTFIPNYNISFRTTISATSASVTSATITGSHFIPRVVGIPARFAMNGARSTDFLFEGSAGC